MTYTLKTPLGKIKAKNKLDANAIRIDQILDFLFSCHIEYEHGYILVDQVNYMAARLLVSTIDKTSFSFLITELEDAYISKKTHIKLSLEQLRLLYNQFYELNKSTKNNPIF